MVDYPLQLGGPGHLHFVSPPLANDLHTLGFPVLSVWVGALEWSLVGPCGVVTGCCITGMGGVVSAHGMWVWGVRAWGYGEGMA
jgi:hypothetical protein